MSAPERTDQATQAHIPVPNLNGQPPAVTGGGTWRRRWLRWLAALAAIGILGAGMVWWQNGRAGSTSTVDPADGQQTTTAPVVRRTLYAREQVSGTLGYADGRSVVNGRHGIVTWLPREGGTVKRGQVLYRVDDQPVPLLYGGLPLYRRLSVGVDDGRDVAQLERNLTALGYDPGTVDNHFSSATAAALKRWQKALGLQQTGALEPGDAIVSPGPVRIAEHKTSVGAPAGQGQTVMTATGTARQVAVDLDAAKQSYVRVGDKVEVTLPDGRTTTGTVSSVSRVAKHSGDSGSGDDEATVSVTVSLDRPKDAGSLDQAPVQVAITTETARNVLAVPVNALLALAEGGYAVEVQGHAGARHLVPIKLGLFANGLVEVRGSGLRAGMKVVVPP